MRRRGRSAELAGGESEGVAATVLVPTDLVAAGEVRLAGDTFHHLVRVRRLEAGERLRLVDGAGRVASGELVAIERHAAVVAVEPGQVVAPAARRVELLVAMPKPERAAWMVEKVTELGVAAVTFVATERSVRQPRDAGVERLRRIAVAALEQSHGAWLPVLADPLPLWKALDHLGDGGRRVLLDGGGIRPEPREFDRVVLAVGPEGGWTAEERADFAAAGFATVTIGELVFRVETAAVLGVGLAAIGFA
jgi:16S rRNA (uracil1498-N3)-methyltransferase